MPLALAPKKQPVFFQFRWWFHWKRLLIFGLVWSFYNVIFPTITFYKYGLLDRQGHFVIPPKFDSVEIYSDGHSTVGNYAYDDNWRLWHAYTFTHSGQLESSESLQWDRPPRKDDYNDGFGDHNCCELTPQTEADKQFVVAGARTDYGYSALGYTNSQGKWLIGPKNWNLVTNFSQGIAFVRVGTEDNGRWGMINTKGEYILKPICRRIWPFEQDLAKCQLAYKQTQFLLSPIVVERDLKKLYASFKYDGEP